MFSRPMPEQNRNQDRTRPRAAGVVLVVDDNSINRMVLQEMLQQEHYTVRVAVHGAEAVEVFADEAVDFVLMDVMMPIMDGYEATRIIRSRPEFAGIPVIAMTANAMERDLELAREAGMVCTVTKPVDPAALYRTLVERIVPDPAKPFDAPRDPAEVGSGRRAEPDQAVLPGSLPGIDLEVGLSHLAGKVTAYLGLLRRFPERQGSCVEAIRSCLGRGETAEAIRLAHTLKGVAGSLGAAGLSAAAREVESALKEGRPAEGTIDALEGALALVVRGLESWIAAEQGRALRAVGPADLDRARELVDSLERLLGDNDTAALGALDDLRSLGIPELEGSIAAVYARADNYDFDAALEGVGALRAKLGGVRPAPA